MDQVNHPKHYAGKGLEAIDVIEAFDLDFNLGCAVKYILRAGHKGDTVTDLRKCIWYIEREIQKYAPGNGAESAEQKPAGGETN